MRSQSGLMLLYIIHIIYNYGQIYLDKAVLIVKNLDVLLDNREFVGYENLQYLFTGIFSDKKLFACKLQQNNFKIIV